MTKFQEWRNRIVGYDVVPAEDLLANPSNWRIHPRAQQEALTGVLDDIGWVQEIIVNKTTGHVVDGHMRVAVAISRHENVPVKYVELSEAEEKLILATIDPISAMAGVDSEQLDALLQSVNSDNEAVQAMLAQLAEANGLLLGDQDTDSDASPVDIQSQYMIMIECVTEFEQNELLERFTAEGIKCRALVS